MGLYLQHASPQLIQAGNHASAAIYAFRNGDCAKADAHWEKYFSCDPDQHDSDNLAIAGEFYSQQDNYKRSIELLEAYFKKAKKERWNKKYVLVLGYNYHMVGKHKQACKYYNSIFVDNEIQKEYLADIPPTGYGIIAQSYLFAGETAKAEKVLKLFSQTHPNCQVMLTVKKEEVSVPTTQKRGRGRGREAASRVVSRPVASETPAQRIRALLKVSTLEKCDEVLNALELMSFEEMPETSLYQEERLSLVEKAVAFKDRVLKDDAKQSNELQSTSELRKEITQLERQTSSLKQKHHKMERARAKKTPCALLGKEA
jgi:tetratricopeptide (TPR) repeat protein